MPYRRSVPLNRWLKDRKEDIETLAAGHAHVGGILGGAGRPLGPSKPLAHAYLIVAVGQFQGFVRELHDLAAESLIDAAGISTTYATLLNVGITHGRGIDRGNATVRTIKSDFARLGITPFTASTYSSQWGTDQHAFDTVLQLRNTLAHGNERALQDLLATGTVRDTVTWTRRQLPMLNRMGRAFDKMVWHHLNTVTGKGPW